MVEVKIYPWQTEWRGSVAETTELIENILLDIRDEYGIRLGRREILKLFCEVMSRHGMKDMLAREMKALYLDYAGKKGRNGENEE